MFQKSSIYPVIHKPVLYIGLMLLFGLACTMSFAQKGYMTIRGKVILNEKGLTGVNVVLLKNGTKVDEALTASSGKYTFNELMISPEGDTYIIKISKPGHITIKHWVSTKAPDDRKVVFPDYFPEVELFRKVKEVEREKALSNILDKPISKFGYSVNKGDFADDGAYFSTITARVNQLFEILDAEERERKRLLAAYRMKQLEEENKANEEAKAEKEKSSFEQKYDDAVAKADKSFGKKKYRKSMAQYKDVLTLVSKCGLTNKERDKLKKHPKRRIYDLETLMAELSEEELDELEKDEVEIADSKEDPVDEVEAQEIEEEEEVDEEEVVEVEPLSESEIAKMEAEKALPDAMGEKNRVLKEEMDQVELKRKESMEIAASKTMQSNIEVKQHEVAASMEEKKTAQKISKNKEVVANRNKEITTMMAKAKVASVKASTSGTYKERPYKASVPDRPVVLSSSMAADKDKKKLRSVVVVHNRIKVAEIKKNPTVSHKTVGGAKTYKPKSFQYEEKSFYKTITNTIIKYPVKQDTLQQVDYLWGASYYYKNTEEIDENAYNAVIKSLK